MMGWAQAYGCIAERQAIPTEFLCGNLLKIVYLEA
jgi:hypothetical protein